MCVLTHTCSYLYFLINDLGKWVLGFPEIMDPSLLGLLRKRIITF